MKTFKAMMLALVLLLPAAPVLAQAAADEARNTAIALLDAMDAGDYAAAEAMMSAEMAAAVPAARLRAVWESLPAQAGAAQGRGEPAVTAAGDVQVVKVPLQYAHIGLVATISVQADGRVAGFLVQPAAAAAPPPPAPPAAAAEYSERETTIGSGERALPATLALPDGEGPFPAMVLVHGSGPHDRDETVGPNRPFLDIARGLAAQGIVVLRYEKRTRARPQDYAEGNITIDSETTDDAVLAVQALHALPQVDGKRVFVFGHSQGGMMAPRIATRAAAVDAPVAGLVLLAAPARKLLDIIVEQNRRLAVLDDARIGDAERAAIEGLRAQVDAIREGGEVESTPLRLPAAYWRSTDAVDPVAEAVAADLPMLVLQGARDIQVVDADWQLWKGAFHDDAQVQFKLYPALNHLGIAGEGDGNLAEYQVPGHVDAGLIDDVAAWIRAR